MVLLMDDSIILSGFQSTTNYRPDNTESNVYEMWIHATRLRDPARVKPLVKSQDPPLSKVTLRTRKRLCRGKSHLICLSLRCWFAGSLSLLPTSSRTLSQCGSFVLIG